MPSISMLIRGEKEPVDNRQPYLKPSKEKREESKSQKVRKPKGEKKPAPKEGTPREEQ